MCDSCRPLPDVADLDQRSVSLAVDEGDIVLLGKAITPDGHPHVVQGCSEGTDCITETASPPLRRSD